LAESDNDQPRGKRNRSVGISGPIWATRCRHTRVVAGLATRANTEQTPSPRPRQGARRLGNDSEASSLALLRPPAYVRAARSGGSASVVFVKLERRSHISHRCLEPSPCAPEEGGLTQRPLLVNQQSVQFRAR